MVIVQSKDVKKRVNGTKTSVLMPFLMERNPLLRVISRGSPRAKGVSGCLRHGAVRRGRRRHYPDCGEAYSHTHGSDGHPPGKRQGGHPCARHGRPKVHFGRKSHRHRWSPCCWGRWHTSSCCCAS